MLLPFPMDDLATFSEDRVYRYTLRRQWSEAGEIAFLMANPSTANESKLDPTIRRCIGFAKAWGFGSILVLNLYAYRSTDPRALKLVSDPVGPKNRSAIADALCGAKELICAWGCGEHIPDLRHPRELLDGIRLRFPALPINCLGYRADGHPRHPLMLPATMPREPFVWKVK